MNARARMRGQQPLPSGTYRDPPSPSVTDRPPRGLRDTVERRRQRRRPRSARLRLTSPERQPVEPFVNSPSMFDGLATTEIQLESYIFARSPGGTNWKDRQM